jgi:hypothetical protein
MFLVSEAEAAAIRSVFEQKGALCASIELRRLFPLITDNEKAQEFARIIAGWKPLPALGAGGTPVFDSSNPEIPSPVNGSIGNARRPA